MSVFLQTMKGKIKRQTLKHFLELATRLQTQNPNSPVVSFAVSVIEGLSIDEADVPLVESFLILSASLAPRHMDRICTMLINLQHHTKVISKDRIRGRFVQLLEQNLNLGNSFEAIWLLHTLRGLKIKFASKIVSELAESYQGASVPLILLDIASKGIFCGKLPKEIWENGITSQTILHDWTWLLGYEGFRHGWLNDTHNLLNGPFFKPMLDKGVVFYDETKSVKTSASIRKKRVERSRISLQDAQALLAHLAPRNQILLEDNFGEY